MEPISPGNEFEALIDEEGNIAIPPDLLKELVGRKLHVRIQKREVAAALQEKGVTEDEIARLAKIQLEPREQVIKFLLSEGALKSNRTFSRRTKGEKR